MSDILRSSYAHKISWCVGRQLRCGKCHYFTDKVLTLSDTDSSYCDTIPSILTEKIHRLLSEIQIGPSLHDRKQDTTNSIILRFEMIECSLRSTVRHLHLLLNSRFIGTTR